MSWTADDIIEANPPQPGQTRSKLERLLVSAQLNLDLAADVANEIERREANHIAAFFQLPYPVHVQNGWHRVSTGTAGLAAELRVEVCRLTMSAGDEFRLVRSAEPGVAG